MRYGLTEED